MNVPEYLNSLDSVTKDPTLDMMNLTMNKFGNPEKNMKFIHVAGTSGKGSICEMLSSILILSGLKVGKFISPYLIDFKEGISINNKNINDEDLNKIMEELMPIFEGKLVKRFEAITSIALKYFYDMKCDIVVLETGLGGTTDCTNIVHPVISVIGNIGFDHMDLLGNTIEEIASHKLGIIKENSNTVTFYQDTVTDMAVKVCKEKKNRLNIVKKEDINNYSYDEEYQKFDYKNIKDIKINLKGEVQTENAAVAIECINVLNQNGFNIIEENIKEGLKNIVHKARFEILKKGPLIIFDGAHNEDKILNLKKTIKQYYPNKKVVYIISILKTKDHKTIIKHLLEDKDAIIYFTDGTGEERYIKFKDTLENAIEDAIKKYPERLICITGSFYTYPEVIKFLNQN